MGYLDIQFSDSIPFHVVDEALLQMHKKIRGPDVEYTESDTEVAECLVEICTEWMNNERKEFNA